MSIILTVILSFSELHPDHYPEHHPDHHPDHHLGRHPEQHQALVSFREPERVREMKKETSRQT